MTKKKAVKPLLCSNKHDLRENGVIASPIVKFEVGVKDILVETAEVVTYTDDEWYCGDCGTVVTEELIEAGMME